MVAFKSCNALIRQLTHGLGGGVAPNSLHRGGRKHLRADKRPPRELSRAAFETNCGFHPVPFVH